MALNIVLVYPEIPNNTGNIGRLSLAVGARLHLIKPFGFELSDKRVKRAGLDYWKHVDLHIYESWEEFVAKNTDAQLALLSARVDQSYLDIPFQNDIYLVFGQESVGLPTTITDQYPTQQYRIPIVSKHIRSLNLANAVSIVSYEGLRKISSESA